MTVTCWELCMKPQNKIILPSLQSLVEETGGTRNSKVSRTKGAKEHFAGDRRHFLKEALRVECYVVGRLADDSYSAR